MALERLRVFVVEKLGALAEVARIVAGEGGGVPHPFTLDTNHISVQQHKLKVIKTKQFSWIIANDMRATNNKSPTQDKYHNKLKYQNSQFNLKCGIKRI